MPGPSSSLRLLLATTNRGKLRELRALLDGIPGLVLLEPDDVGGLPVVVEDGASFEANARKKALEIARARGVATLSDDSGLEVDALDGRPGVCSARYAGERASDAANNAKLVQELAAVPSERRNARYRAVIAFCDPAGGADAPVTHTEEGRCEGRIQLEAQGHAGFGYDPHFVPEGHACTMAELSLEQKNRISHRALAVLRMRAYFEDYLRDQLRSSGGRSLAPDAVSSPPAGVLQALPRASGHPSTPPRRSAMTRHVAVWIDHQEAKIFHVEAETFDAKSVHAPGRHLHRHPVATTDHAHSGDLSHFFKDVTQALADAEEILIVGPATAKLELIKYVHTHLPALTPKIVGVETVDHPTDGQLVAYARKYFLAADRTR